jgi:hypothetical protein
MTTVFVVVQKNVPNFFRNNIAEIRLTTSVNFTTFETAKLKLKPRSLNQDPLNCEKVTLGQRMMQMT